MEEKKILLNSLSINYKSFGQGASVLVLHGWGGKSDSWVEVGKMLGEAGFSVIIPDLPGFGKSAEPKTPWTVADYLKFVEDFAAVLGLDKFDLIGHSFGGGLAAAYCAKHPENIGKLVLCDSAIIRKERLGWRQSCAKKMAQAGKLALKFPFRGGLLELAQKMVYKIAGVQDYHQASPVMKKTFQNVVKEDLSDYARQIKTPTLIVWGKDDKSTLVEDAIALHKMIPGAQLEMVKGAAHNPHRTHPKELAGIISKFLFNQRPD